MSIDGKKRSLCCSAAALMLIASGSAFAETGRPETIGQIAAAHSGAPASTATQPDAPQGGAAGSASAAATGAENKRDIGESYGAVTASSGTSNTPSLNDRNMMHNLAMANLAELSAARLALSKAQNPQVKAYAQQMIDDHTKAMSELASLAQSRGVTLPTEPDAQHQSAVARLKGQSADDFSEEYLEQSGVTDHRNTLRLLVDMREDADDPQLKKLAEKMIPIVESHLQRGELLAGVKGMSKPRDMQSGTPAAR